MYIPGHFVQSDADKTRRLVDRHAFGLLVTTGPGGTPVASHIPFLNRDGENGWVLEGHLARPNGQTDAIRQGAPALAVFQGPHAYISPTWYETFGVPTWNYDAVHVYGRLREVTGRTAGSIIERLANKFEGDGPEAWVPSYPDAMLGGIVCFVMTDLEVQSKSKMSQNRPDVDRAGVIEALGRSNDPTDREVGEVMRDNESNSRHERESDE